MTVPFNRQGGLTLVPLPGFEAMAETVAARIRAIGGEAGADRWDTPVDIALPIFGTRASGEPFLQFSKRHVGGHDCVLLGSGPGTWEALGQMQMALRYLAARRAGRIALATGYFPLSRSDKDEGGLELALPRFIIDQLISASGGPNGSLDRIISVDLHAPQVVMGGTTGLVTELSMVGRVVRHAVQAECAAGEPIVVAFPDDGGQKRVGGMLDALEQDLGIPVPSVCGVKRRKSSTEASLLRVFGPVESIAGATVLCVDDEIATGGTNIATARAMKSQYGARRVVAVVTHGVLCGDAAARFSAEDCPVDRIYCSDTIPVEGRLSLRPLIEAGRLVTVSWANDLAWAIYGHHWDLSIREVR